MGRRATDRDKKQRHDWSVEHPHHNWACTVVSGHRRRGIEVRLSNHQELEDFSIGKDRCACCGTELNWEYGTKNRKIQHNSPTVDRINNERFIDRNNIRIVCRRCNMAKGDGTLDGFITYCRMIAQNTTIYPLRLIDNRLVPVSL